jgi:hypothetical protein
MKTKHDDVRRENAPFTLAQLPFDIGFYHSRPENIPAHLPFTLAVDQGSGLIHQVLSNDSREALRRYYLLGGYASTPLGEGEYGKIQGEYMLRALRHVLSLQKKEINQLKFLEIGASYGVKALIFGSMSVCMAGQAREYPSQQCW